MSETSTQTSTSRTGGNVFKNKVGMLPLWGWMAVVGVLALLYSYYRKNKSTSATKTSAAQAAGNAPGGVDASLVPQFINQNYEETEPPAAPSVTINNQVPMPPTVGPKPPPVRSPQPVSGEPGSYTSGLQGGINEWTSNGKYSLNTLARSHGMTAQQLIAVSERAENNVPLKAYVSKGNLNAPLPAGVQIFIPNANWKTVKLWPTCRW